MPWREGGEAGTREHDVICGGTGFNSGRGLLLSLAREAIRSQARMMARGISVESLPQAYLNISKSLPIQVLKYVSSRC